MYITTYTMTRVIEHRPDSECGACDACEACAFYQKWFGLHSDVFGGPTFGMDELNRRLDRIVDAVIESGLCPHWPIVDIAMMVKAFNHEYIAKRRDYGISASDAARLQIQGSNPDEPISPADLERLYSIANAAIFQKYGDTVIDLKSPLDSPRWMKKYIKRNIRNIFCEDCIANKVHVGHH